MGRDDEAHGGGKGPRRRRLELRRRLLERCEAIRHVDSLQPPFSLIRRDAARERDSVVREPRHRRHLLQPDAVGHADRELHRRARGGVGRRRLAARLARIPAAEARRNLALRDALRPIAQRHGTSVSAVAVAWTLAWPGVTGAIVGARTPEQVDGWIGAASDHARVRRTSTEIESLITTTQILESLNP